MAWRSRSVSREYARSLRGQIAHYNPFRNYNGSLLIDLYRYAEIKPAMLQIEHHPLLTQQSVSHVVLKD